MSNENRVPAGVPTGGQFAASAKSESGVALANDVPVAVHAEAFTAAVERYDLDPDLVGPGGLTLAQAWDERFAVLSADEVEATEHVIRDVMGNPNYGRERSGPWLVWYDPNNTAMSEEDWNGEPTGQWEQVTPANIDDPRGRVLAARVHTRNGGGNRECWNDDSEECGPECCTAGIVDALQARPDHLHDEDDDGDCTYADFYFRLPEDPRLAQSVRQAQTSAAQRQARTLLEHIESGQKGPWDVFGPSAETDLMLAEATERTRAPYPARPGDRSLYWLPNSPTDEDAAYLDAYISAARNGEDAPANENTDWRANWRRSLPSGPITWGKREHAAHDKVADLTEVDRDYRAGRVPESTMRLIGGHASIEDQLAKAERDLTDAQTRLMRDLAPLEQARDWMNGFRAVTASREAAKAEVADLTWAHRWPGTPDTVPARPEPEPFEDIF